MCDRRTERRTDISRLKMSVLWWRRGVDVSGPSNNAWGNEEQNGTIFVVRTMYRMFDIICRTRGVNGGGMGDASPPTIWEGRGREGTERT